MNLSNCHYYVVVYNSKRLFRIPYNTLHGSKRCFIRYKNIGFHCELHDRFSGFVLRFVSMEKCKPFNKHKYRVFQNYFGKFYDTIAICDCPDIDTAELLVKLFTEYHKNRLF